MTVVFDLATVHGGTEAMKEKRFEDCEDAGS
jgi:hypothetical protein